MTTISFVVHGRTRARHRLYTEIEKIFQDYSIRIVETQPESTAQHLTQQLIEDASDYIIIAGGDGSLNEGINGYMLADPEQRNTTVLGLLPYGTGNDFARSLGVDKDLRKLLTAIQLEQHQTVDVAEMQFTAPDKSIQTRYFINIADIGLGGHMARNMVNHSRFLGASMTYFSAIVKSFLTYQKQAINLKTQDIDWHGSILSLCIANGKYFGGGLCVAPDAKLSDGQLQIVLLSNVGLLDYLLNLGKIRKGIKLDHLAGVTYSTSTSCQVHTNSEDCPVEVDGEYIGTAPLTVNIQPAAVRLLTH